MEEDDKKTKKAGETRPWEAWGEKASARGAVLCVLGLITLAVAILSVAVSYDILEPVFGGWAVPTVGALDALWVVVQVTEILAGNNRRRARRVQIAGFLLTAVNAAVPTADLILSSMDNDKFELAVVLTPVAIVMTKLAWWVVLPSLGRPVSDRTRQDLATKRQQVADHLEEMEAEAAHRIELLKLAAELETRVAKAETTYRRSVLKAQQTTTEKLHGQAATTEKTVAEKALPPSVAAIRLPVLGEWKPSALALPGTPDGARHIGGTQVNALPPGTGTPNGGTPAHPTVPTVTLAELASVAGVPVPEPGQPLTDEQLDVVLRHVRYAEDPPTSYRKARDTFRRAGYVGSTRRIRIAWGALLAHENADETFEDEDESEDASV
ncbi:hypothetical protein [Streptomyces sp. NBC_01237]|uniref:hypothetical protein n=1 Tax=Streptomyces sp. NBC_01237 TaxID=2903790 RepID=UPI002DDC4A0E|nr:hypothetical protein [Streptomyces sp. NBC_01237]WRZ76586.1 hypothetical protein OG251_35975 [Streptomyces sp. NBC_01237]